MQNKSLTKAKTMEQMPKTIVEFYCGKQIATNEGAMEIHDRIYELMKPKVKFIRIVQRYDYDTNSEYGTIGYNKQFDGVCGYCFYRISDIKSITEFSENIKPKN